MNYISDFISEQPLYIIAGIIIVILLGFGLYSLIKIFQHRDPLPEKLPNCIWHTKVKKIERIYDGDTFFAHVKGHNPIDKKAVGIRVRGIDTPEMKDKNPKIKRKAEKAKNLAIATIENAGTIHLYNVSTKDKYGRLLATVFCDNRDLGKTLLEAKLAKPYDGGKKSTWS